jgi:hypothetical protein
MATRRNTGKGKGKATPAPKRGRPSRRDLTKSVASTSIAEDLDRKVNKIADAPAHKTHDDGPGSVPGYYHQKSTSKDTKFAYKQQAARSRARSRSRSRK